MLIDEQIRLIDSYDTVPVDLRQLREPVVNESVISIPLDSPTRANVYLLTGFLAAVATPLSVLIYRGMASEMSPSQRQLLLAPAVGIWALAVLGPILIWFIVPIGSLRPDHILRFNRDSDELSIWSRTPIALVQVACLLAVADVRQEIVELQVVTCEADDYTAHYVLACRGTDSYIAFERWIEVFSTYAEIPVCFATIKMNGEIVSSCYAAKEKTAS